MPLPDHGLKATAPAAISPSEPVVASVVRSTQRGLLHHIVTHPYSTITLIALGAMLIGAVVKHQSEWDEAYVAASRALLQGKDIYKDVGANTYPPFSSWLFLPFTFLPIRIARGMWFCINALSFIGLVTVSWRLAGGKRIEPTLETPPAKPREQAAFLIGHLVALQLALNG